GLRKHLGIKKPRQPKLLKNKVVSNVINEKGSGKQPKEICKDNSVQHKIVEVVNGFYKSYIALNNNNMVNTINKLTERNKELLTKIEELEREKEGGYYTSHDLAEYYLVDEDGNFHYGWRKEIVDKFDTLEYVKSLIRATNTDYYKELVEKRIKIDDLEEELKEKEVLIRELEEQIDSEALRLNHQKLTEEENKNKELQKALGENLELVEKIHQKLVVEETKSQELERLLYLNTEPLPKRPSKFKLLKEKTKSNFKQFQQLVKKTKLQAQEFIARVEAWNEEANCSFCSNLLGGNSKAVCQIRTRSRLNEKIVANDEACEICKEKFENNELPKCERCGRLQIRSYIDIRSGKYICYCIKYNEDVEKKELPVLPHERRQATFYERQINGLREELNTAEVEIETHLEALEISEVWNKKQKQELLDEISRLKRENERLKKQTSQELLRENEELKAQLAKQNQQQSQIEVKSNKKPFSFFGKKS
ncbi:22792_t:CDS:2, partial [Racocetra persica]